MRRTVYLLAAAAVMLSGCLRGSHSFSADPDVTFAAHREQVLLVGPFVLGTSYNQPITQSGQLSLMFWDSNFEDNFGFVTAAVDVVPEPATFGLVGLGLVAIRRRLAR